MPVYFTCGNYSPGLATARSDSRTFRQGGLAPRGIQMVTVPATVEPQKGPGGIDLSVIKACLAVSINAMPRPAALVDAAGQIVATNLAFRSEIDAVSAKITRHLTG